MSSQPRHRHLIRSGGPPAAAPQVVTSLVNARKVIIVPGYGLAVAQGQYPARPPPPNPPPSIRPSHPGADPIPDAATPWVLMFPRDSKSDGGQTARIPGIVILFQTATTLPQVGYSNALALANENQCVRSGGREWTVQPRRKGRPRRGDGQHPPQERRGCHPQPPPRAAGRVAS